MNVQLHKIRGTRTLVGMIECGEKTVSKCALCDLSDLQRFMRPLACC